MVEPSYDPDNFEPGEMNIRTQEETFDGFVKVCVYVTVATVGVLIFLAIIGT